MANDAEVMPFLLPASSGQGVQGALHRPKGSVHAGLVLTHGAGSNSGAPLLVALAEAFSQAGVLVLRCDLPFRQRRPHGPPRPGDAVLDREGLRQAVAALRTITPLPVWLGGHSYGGRQASMLAAEDPSLASALLLLSYPLHPPGKPLQLRTGHFAALRAPVMFVQGAQDSFATQAEIKDAVKAISAPVRLLFVPDAGHDLGFSGRRGYPGLPDRIVAEFLGHTEAIRLGSI